MEHGIIWAEFQHFGTYEQDNRSDGRVLLQRAPVKADMSFQLTRLAAQIRSKRIMYKVPGPNSNSVAYTACVNFGYFTKANLNGFTPGWGTDLLRTPNLETQPE